MRRDLGIRTGGSLKLLNRFRYLCLDIGMQVESTSGCVVQKSYL